ncbi:MAG: hypothetical protein HQL52_19900 [Magnetococcales bacterium]|nr:hypothetical protein [Magnetococcales bacterium]
MKKEKNPDGNRGFNGASDCETERNHYALDHKKNQPTGTDESGMKFYPNLKMLSSPSHMDATRHSPESQKIDECYEARKQEWIAYNRCSTPEKYEQGIQVLVVDMGV